jgi:DNA-binding beta-propeller fold protein YncE
MLQSVQSGLVDQANVAIGIVTTGLRARVLLGSLAALAVGSGSAAATVSGLGAGESAAPGFADCSTAVASAPRLAHATTAFTAVGGSPFGVAISTDGRFSFLADGEQVVVLSDQGLVPRVIRRIVIPGNAGGFGLAAGATITRNGRYLLVADGSGAVVLSLARAEAGASDAILGTLSTPPGASTTGPGRGAIGAPHGGAIEVTTSPDGRYAFVSLEYDDLVAVFDLGAAITSDFRSSHFVGTIPLGSAVVGMAVSPDGRWLYATSELGTGTPPTPAASAPISGTATTGSSLHRAPSGGGGEGTLSVIDLSRAETNPPRSVISTVEAGCNPVRVAVSPDGLDVWVAARESDELLAFSASRLLSDPRRSLLASVRVGEAPVGLALLDEGRYVVAADSNRFDLPGATAALTLVSTSAALAGKEAVVATLPAGRFPRDLAVSPSSRTLLVSNFVSGQLEAVDLASLAARRMTTR